MKNNKSMLSMTFSANCSHCINNKKLYKKSLDYQLATMLRQAAKYIDTGDYPGNEYQAELAKEIKAILSKKRT